MKTEIGQAMRKLRKAKKMTQDTLAEKLGVAPANISRYEKGQQGIEVDKLPTLADALGYLFRNSLLSHQVLKLITLNPPLN